MKRLLWGKSLGAVAKKKADGSYDKFKLLPEMAENSMQLNTAKGEKQEAKVEGGGVEAVRYSKNTYDLVADFRRGLDDSGTAVSFPFEDVDGVVDGVYALRIQPEDKEAGGLTVREVIISTEDTFTAKDGAVKRVKFDFLKPSMKADGSQDPTINWDPIQDLLAAMTASQGAS